MKGILRRREIGSLWKSEKYGVESATTGILEGNAIVSSLTSRGQGKEI
jgi:hypothetical protein